MADKKASAFTIVTTAASTDYYPVITGIGTTPANSVITKANFKTDLALVKADVGLGSVDNTADTAKTIAGDVTGTLGASTVGKINGTSLATLATGILKNTTTTGVPSIAVAADFPTLNQNTTGTASNVTGTVAIANGGSGQTTAQAAIDALTAVSGATNEYVLTKDTASGHAIFKAAAGGGGGQTLVTKVVAASGGDYTTLGAALAAASDGWVIHVYPGTYTESAITSSLTNLTIVGAGAESSILSFGSNALTMSGTKVRFINVQMTFSTGGAVFSGTYAEVLNCHVYQTTISSTVLLNFSGSYGTLENSYISRPVNSTGQCIQSAFYFNMNGNKVESGQGSNGELLNAGGYNTITGNFFNVTSGGNGGTAVINLATGLTTFSGNTVSANSFGAGQLLFNDPGDCVITGNYFYGGSTSTVGVWPRGVGTIISGNVIHLKSASSVGVKLSGPSCTVTGNTIRFDVATSTIGVSVVSGAGADDCVITGNRFNNVDTGVSIPTGTNKTLVVANSFSGFTTASVADSGTGSVVANNAT